MAKRLSPEELIEGWFIEAEAEYADIMIARINLIMRTRNVGTSKPPAQITTTIKKRRGRPPAVKAPGPLVASAATAETAHDFAAPANGDTE